MSRCSFLLRPLIVFWLATLVTAVSASTHHSIPLRDWPVPALSQHSGGLEKSAAVAGNPVVFVKMNPCRVYDSRIAAGGPGPITGGTSRTISISGSRCTGVPANAAAFSLNITVTGSTGSTDAFITAYPTGTTRPLAATVNFRAGTQVGNAAIVPSGTAGQIDIYASITTEVIIDINGYFTDTPDAGYQFVISADSGGKAAILGVNNNATAGSHGVGGYAGGAGVVHGVQGQAGSAAFLGSSGVHGINDSGFANVYGVLGEITSTTAGGGSAAVRGINNSTTGFGFGGSFSQAGSGIGVHGEVSGAGIAVDAVGNGGIGVYASDTIGTAIYAVQQFPSTGATIMASTAGQTAKNTFGVEGSTGSTATNSAGVLGYDATGIPGVFFNFGYPSSGVLGLSKGNIGVLGISENAGIAGVRADANGGNFVEGDLGYLNYGVFASGDLGVTGVKNFVEPHPSDASLVIRYAALEGPEAGTYFRGRGRFVNGRAVIAVPENFRIVTDEDGLTVNITTLRGFAMTTVSDINLNTITLESTKDVEFFYLVQGVRKAYKNYVPVSAGEEFVPRGPDARIPDSLSAEARRRLIANGTYNADGTVNMQTAERLGWAKQWRDREAENAKLAEAANRRLAREAQRIRQQHNQ